MVSFIRCFSTTLDMSCLHLSDQLLRSSRQYWLTWMLHVESNWPTLHIYGSDVTGVTKRLLKQNSLYFIWKKFPRNLTLTNAFFWRERLYKLKNVEFKANRGQTLNLIGFCLVAMSWELPQCMWQLLDDESKPDFNLSAVEYYQKRLH